MPAPVILFDGVCNLCHAAVAWVIERDTRQVFRFASLQSAAARQLLAAAGVAGELPDSVILVDEQGVHTRSDAAMRIAARLGWPWRLLAVGRALPPLARNALYGWVARNRYGWFGRREACLVPSAQLAGRFLDAGEQILVGPPAPASEPRLGLLELFIHAYLLVYIFPFPLSGVPGAESVTDRYDALWQKAIQWVATRVVHVDASILPGGSGDTTFNYVETLVDAGLALVLAVGVWLWGKASAGGVREAMRVYVRYSLGAVMLSYGWHKLFPLQMMPPGPDRLVNALADTSPMGLLWTFIGLSPAYQMLCGLVEVVGGLLLLFRRTTLLGALITAGAMAQVVALNFCYDVPVKLFSSHLWASSLYLLAPDLPRLVSFLLLALPAQPAPVAPLRFGAAWARRLRWTAKAMAIAVFAVLPVFVSFRAWRDRASRDPGPWHGMYAVESFETSGPDGARRWARVGINGLYHGVGILRGDGTVRRYGYLIDGTNRVFTLNAPQGVKIALAYRETQPGQLSLEGEYEGARVKVGLRRLPATASLLTSRGFRWVNERPFNR